MKRWIAAAIFSALCGMLLCACSPSVSDSEGPAEQSSDTDSVRQDGNGEDIAGVTLEDQLAWSDSILEARFVYEEDHGTYQLYYFEPVDQLRGRIDGPQFAVRYVCRAVKLTESGPRGERAPYGFKAGREYLLVLERVVSVTQPEDYYYIVGNLQYEKPDAAGDGMDTYQALRSEIVETAEGIPLQSPPYTGKAYIQSDDPAEIAAGSDYVVKAKVAESSGGNELNDTEWFFCEITEVYKSWGVPPEGKAEIIFPSGAVSPGGEYILLLTYPDNEWPSDLPAPFYIMSSKNSIYQPDDPVVGEILRAAEQDA